MTKQYRLLNRDGSMNVVRKDHGKIQRDDLYFSLLSLSWPKFIFFVGLFFLGINFFFGLAYFVIGANSFEGMRTHNEWAHFLDSFFFSVQSFATIGYGRISPISVTANFLVTVEALSGILFTALATGLVFGRFSKPVPKIIFSEKVLITRIDNEPCMVIRVANERLNQVAEAQIKMFTVQNQVTAEGEKYRDFANVRLERESSPMFSLPWTIVHPIDENSPLYGSTPEKLKANDVELFANLTGIDETLSQTIFARTSYVAEDFVWDHRFQDIITRDSAGKLQVDLERIHQTQPLETP